MHVCVSESLIDTSFPLDVDIDMVLLKRHAVSPLHSSSSTTLHHSTVFHTCVSHATGWRLDGVLYGPLASALLQTLGRVGAKRIWAQLEWQYESWRSFALCVWAWVCVNQIALVRIAQILHSVFGKCKYHLGATWRWCKISKCRFGATYNPIERIGFNIDDWTFISNLAVWKCQ